MKARLALCSCVLLYHHHQVMKCDLGELESVRAFAREFQAKHGRQLNVLVNNGEMNQRLVWSKKTSGRCVSADYMGTKGVGLIVAARR